MGIPKAILDTNVYLTFLLSANPMGTTFDRLVDAGVSRKYDLLLPIGVIIELNAVAERPRLAKRISHRQIELLLRCVSTFATILPVSEEAPPRVCRDPDDDYLIAAGISHGANFLVTRDRDLLSLDPVLEMRVLDPMTFLSLILTELSVM